MKPIQTPNKQNQNQTQNNPHQQTPANNSSKPQANKQQTTQQKPTVNNHLQQVNKQSKNQQTNNTPTINTNPNIKAQNNKSIKPSQMQTHQVSKEVNKPNTKHTINQKHNNKRPKYKTHKLQNKPSTTTYQPNQTKITIKNQNNHHQT